jgi:hypothetical protein
MDNTILYLIGFPGTGKLTIAEEICRREPGFKLLHNHLINDPLFTVLDLDGKTPIPGRVWDNQMKIWRAVLDTIVHVSPPRMSFIFTNHLSQDHPGDVAWFGEIQGMAEARGARFVPVRLTIDPEEHARRITTEERRARMKQTDPDAPARYARDNQLIRVDHPNCLNLDVTDFSAGAAASHILEFVEHRDQASSASPLSPSTT